MKKILISTTRIRHYRLPVFNALGARDDLFLTVQHSGPPVGDAAKNFEEIVTRQRHLGSLKWQDKSLARMGDCDVVIATFDLHLLHNMVMPLAKISDVPIIFWGHGFGKQQWSKGIRAWFAKRADALLLYDEHFIDSFVKRGVAQEKIFVAPNTMAIEEPMYNRDQSRRNFLFVGRLRKAKRVDILFREFAKIQDQIPSQVGIAVVGSGDEEEHLRDLAKQLSIAKRVTFHGRVVNEDALRPIFETALAYITPGPIGLGVLHSFAYGVPVVTERHAHHGPEAQNIEDDKNSLFFAAENRPLADILIHLGQNPEESHRLGQAAHQHYTKRRRLKHMVQGFIDAIDFVSGNS